MLRRRALVLILLFVAIAAVAAYVGWAAYAGARIGEGWKGLRPALPYLLAGVVTVGVVIAGFVRLVFYSASRGYDDRAGSDQP